MTDDIHKKISEFLSEVKNLSATPEEVRFGLEAEKTISEIIETLLSVMTQREFTIYIGLFGRKVDSLQIAGRMARGGGWEDSVNELLELKMQLFDMDKDIIEEYVEVLRKHIGEEEA